MCQMPRNFKYHLLNRQQAAPWCESGLSSLDWYVVSWFLCWNLPPDNSTALNSPETCGTYHGSLQGKTGATEREIGVTQHLADNGSLVWSFAMLASHSLAG